MNFETDIFAGVVGLATAVMLFLQIKEQSKFSQRIADLEYIKLMEPKLLAVVYDYNNIRLYTSESMLNENLNSLPPFDWYKFHFLAGKIRNGSNSYTNLSEWKVAPECKEKYKAIFKETVKHIKTEDLRNVFETSRWAEFYQICEK